MKIVSLLLACSSPSLPEQGAGRSSSSSPAATLTHLKWPSFDNIHRAASNLSLNGKFPLDQEVLALEKLDGTNVGLEIDVESGALVGIMGRNKIVWSKDTDEDGREDPFDLRYNVRSTFHPLKDHIPRLGRLAETLVARIPAEDGQAVPSSMVFYGEWFQPSEAPRNELADWYPFGFRFRPPSGNEAYNDHLQTMTREFYQDCLDHELNPPKLMFQGGNLVEAIDALYDQMVAPTDKEFEGVFITLADERPCTESQAREFGAKWKIGQCDEQPILRFEDTVSVLPSLKNTAKKLEQVYLSKREPKQKSKKPRKQQSSAKKLRSLDSQAKLAFASVMSKSPLSPTDIREMKDQTKRQQELDRLIIETHADLCEQYDSVGLPSPPKARNVVAKVVYGVMFSSS